MRFWIHIDDASNRRPALYTPEATYVAHIVNTLRYAPVKDAREASEAYSKAAELRPALSFGVVQDLRRCRPKDDVKRRFKQQE